jgi:WD repeat-containing protein 24
MGQRGRLDRRAVAHSGPILALDWCPSSSEEGGGGWVASAGLDHLVNLWDLSTDSSLPVKPSYTLHTAFPARRVLWRPDYECELAVVSGAGEFGPGVGEVGEGGGVGVGVGGREKVDGGAGGKASSAMGDAVEIWDVRRPWVAKWEVAGSAIEGGLTGWLPSFLALIF